MLTYDRVRVLLTLALVVLLTGCARTTVRSEVVAVEACVALDRAEAHLGRSPSTVRREGDALVARVAYFRKKNALERAARDTPANIVVGVVAAPGSFGTSLVLVPLAPVAGSPFGGWASNRRRDFGTVRVTAEALPPENGGPRSSIGVRVAGMPADAAEEQVHELMRAVRMGSGVPHAQAVP